MRERPEPRCAGRSWLFTSVSTIDHKIARVACLGTDGSGPCPAINACAATVRDIQSGPHQSGLHGTWAGKLYGSRMRKESA